MKQLEIVTTNDEIESYRSYAKLKALFFSDNKINLINKCLFAEKSRLDELILPS